MNKLYVEVLLNIIEFSLNKLAEDKELQQQILKKSENIADWLQVKLGKVNKRSMEESIQLAMDTSVVRDQSTICKIIAAITTLHATHTIDRGAIIGGTLLSKFGSETFPHIKERELKFAKPLNESIYNNILASVTESFDEQMKDYNFKNNADFSSIGGDRFSWRTVSAASYLGPIEFVLNYGATAFKLVKKFMQLKA